MGIGLVAYSFRIKHRGSESNEYEKLDDIDGNDIYDLIHEFLSGYQDKFYTNDETKKAFCINSIEENRELRRVSGLLTSGEAGIPAQIRNINDPQEVLYEKGEDDSECVPLYYLFYLPANSFGILLLEKFGQKSSKYILSKLLNENFRQIFHNYVLEIFPLPQKELMDMYMEHGGIKQFTLASYHSPGSSIEDLYARNGQPIEDDAMYEFTIRSRKNKNLNFLKGKLGNLLNNSENFDSLSNLVGIKDYKPEQVKVTFNINGKTKTVKLDQLDEISAVYDISDEFENSRNHPTYNNINSIAVDYLNSLLGN